MSQREDVPSKTPLHSFSEWPAFGRRSESITERPESRAFATSDLSEISPPISVLGCTADEAGTLAERVGDMFSEPRASSLVKGF